MNTNFIELTDISNNITVINVNHLVGFRKSLRPSANSVVLMSTGLEIPVKEEIHDIGEKLNTLAQIERKKS